MALPPESLIHLKNETGVVQDTKIITPNGEELKSVTKIVIDPLQAGSKLIRATITFLATMDFKIADAHFIEKQLREGRRTPGIVVEDLPKENPDV